MLRTTLLTLCVLAASAGTAPAQTTHTVTLTGFVFSPIEIEIQPGDTVRWVWQGGTHNVESGFKGAFDGNFSSGNPQGGGSFQVTFDQAFLSAHPMQGDVYPYYCITHLFALMYGRILVDRPQPLRADTSLISAGSGGSQNFALDAGPAHAGHLYWMLGSATGTAPGLPSGSSVLPLNLDNYFLFHVTNPNVLIAPSIGFLDGSGLGSTAFAIPPSPQQLASLTLHHAYVVLDPVTFELELASNAWPLTFLL